VTIGTSQTFFYWFQGHCCRYASFFLCVALITLCAGLRRYFCFFHLLNNVFPFLHISSLFSSHLTFCRVFCSSQLLMKEQNINAIVFCCISLISTHVNITAWRAFSLFFACALATLYDMTYLSSCSSVFLSLCLGPCVHLSMGNSTF